MLFRWIVGATQRPSSGPRNCVRRRPGSKAKGFARSPRLHTPYEVVALRGSLHEEHTVAKQAAVKLYDYLQTLFKEKKQKITSGPFSPTGAVRAVMEGIKALYLGGWATSAKGSDTEN